MEQLTEVKGFTGATRETRVTGASKEGEGGGGEEKGKDFTIAGRTRKYRATQPFDQ